MAPTTNGSRTVRPRAALNAEIGHIGLRTGGLGVPAEEFLPVLKGDKAVKVFDEMGENEPVIGAIEFALRMLLRGVNWTVTDRPDGDPVPLVDAEDLDEEARSEVDDERAWLLATAMHDMSPTWGDMIADALRFIRYGYSPMEIVLKKRQGVDGDPRSLYEDGMIGWKRFAYRHPHTRWMWEFGSDGMMTAFVQRVMGTEAGVKPSDPQLVRIPREKLLLFRTDPSGGNPEGRSALRSAYRPWYFKKRIEELESIAIDRNLNGLPRAYVPPEWLTDSQYATQLEMMKKLVQDTRADEQAGWVLPSYFDENNNRLLDVELIASKGSFSNITLQEVIQRKTLEIALTTLMDVVLLGHETVGTQNLAYQKDDLLTGALQAWIDSMGEEISLHAVPLLLKANGMDPSSPSPLYIRPSRLRKVNLAALGDLVAKLAGASMPLFPDPELEATLRRQAEWPPAPSPEETQQLMEERGMMNPQQQMEAQSQMMQQAAAARGGGGPPGAGGGPGAGGVPPGGKPAGKTPASGKPGARGPKPARQPGPDNRSARGARGGNP